MVPSTRARVSWSVVDPSAHVTSRTRCAGPVFVSGPTMALRRLLWTAVLLLPLSGRSLGTTVIAE